LDICFVLFTKTAGDEDSTTLLSSFTSDPLLKSESSPSICLMFEWNLVALKAEGTAFFLADL
jgi:hypothetical protein